jgi:hypothetical protein
MLSHQETKKKKTGHTLLHYTPAYHSPPIVSLANTYLFLKTNKPSKSPSGEDPIIIGTNLSNLSQKPPKL